MSDVHGYKASLSTVTITGGSATCPEELCVASNVGVSMQRNTNPIFRDPRAWVYVYDLVECVLAGILRLAPSKGQPFPGLLSGPPCHRAHSKAV